MQEINLVLDMDGVCANFLPSYLDLGVKINLPVKPPYSDNSRNPELFRIAVLEHQIFKDLPLMPGAEKLKAFITDLQRSHNIKVRMLTSLNSFEQDVMEAGRIQKQAWLDKNGFKWPMVCVCANGEKAVYANPTSILIDDNPECTIPFFKAGGQVVLYNGFNSEFINEFNKCLEKANINELENII